MLLGLVLLTAMATPAMAVSTIQIPASGWDYLGGEGSPSVWSRLGQRVVLEDGEIFAVGYQLRREGEPSGDITLAVRDSETDEVLWSQSWGSAGNLSTESNGSRIMLDIIPSLKVDGDIRVCVEYDGGNATDYVQAGYFSGNKTSGQWYTNYTNYSTDVKGWHDIGEAEEAAYYMSYTAKDTEPVDGDAISSGIPTPLWVVIIALPVTGGLGIWYVKSKRRGT